ncbi:MAG: methylamine dehydrogenase accessory protein MauD [Myxococcota bacterium]
MIDALVVSNIVLWLLVLGLAVTVFALTRQIGVLRERLASRRTLPTRPKVGVGSQSPELVLTDLQNRLVRIGGKAAEDSQTLLFFLSPTCSDCRDLLPTLERVARAEVPRVKVILASEGDLEEHLAFFERDVPSALPYVLSAELGLAFGVGKLPFAVLINAEGLVTAQGLVNTREHLESLFEVQRHGVASIEDFSEKTR